MRAMIRVISTVKLSDARNAPGIQETLVKLAKAAMDKKGVERKEPEVYSQQFLVFFNVLGKLNPTQDDFAKERSARAALLLKEWQELLVSIEELSEFDPERPGPGLEPYIPPASYDGPFTFGMNPEGLTDPAVRAEYAEYLKKRDELIINSTRLEQLRDVQDKYREQVVRFLADTYGTKPVNEAEMKQLIKKNIKDKAATKQLIDAAIEAMNKR